MRTIHDLKYVLIKRPADSDVASRRSRRRKVSIDMDEVSLEIGSLLCPTSHVSFIDSTSADVYPPRQYFILTDAGKPVFTRHLIIVPADDPGR